MLRFRMPRGARAGLVVLPLLSLLGTGCDNADDDGSTGGSGAVAGSSGSPAAATGGGSGTSGGSGAPSSGNGGIGGAGSAGLGGGASQGGATAAGGAGGAAGSGSGNAGQSGGPGAGGTSGTGGAAGASSGMAGGSGTGGQTGEPCATAVYCDDFESYTTTPNDKWTTHTNAGTVAIDTTEHVSGTKSVKFSTQAASSATAMMRLQGGPLLPTPGNVLFGRMLFKLAAAPTASVHWTIIAGLGVVPSQTYHAVYRYGGQQPVTQGGSFSGSQMMANYETPDWYSDKNTPGSDCWHHSNQRVIPVGEWTCVEWKFDGATNGMQLWLDGAAADDLTIAGHGDGCVNAAADYPWTAPSFTSIDLGWESYQADDPRTVFIDDVVISTTKVGCP